MSQERSKLIYVRGPKRCALAVWNDLHRRGGEWQTSELFGDMFRFMGHAPVAHLEGFERWIGRLLGKEGKVDTCLVDVPPTHALSGGMYERHQEKMLDQSLADTFPASDAVSMSQPGGGFDNAAQLAAIAKSASNSEYFADTDERAVEPRLAEAFMAAEAANERALIHGRVTDV
jgi:hypothetical protein